MQTVGSDSLGAAQRDGVALKVARRKKTTQPSQAGGSGSQGGWSMVGGDQSVPEPVGKCTCEV